MTTTSAGEKKYLWTALMPLLLGVASNLFAQQPTVRDPWQSPFASTSIWNTPIGSNAQYVPANLGTLSYAKPDPEFFVRVTSTDPSVTVYYPGSPYRAYGKSVSWLGSMQVPNDFLVPDVDLDPNNYSTPNDCSTFLQPNGESLIQLQPTTRKTAGGPIWGYPQNGENAGGGLHLDGRLGTHYGSGLSAIGGSIRKGEISSVNPIRHAIKIELTWTNLYYNPSNSTNDYGTYRWPAKNSDSGADGRANSSVHYSGTNPALAQGSLLALLPSATVQSLGITTPAGIKLFHAIQDYGAYVVDSTGRTGNWINIPVEDGVQNTEISDWGGDFYRDMVSIYANLYVVDNNGPTSIGGGGTPRVPGPLPIGTNPTPTAGAMYRLVNRVSTPDNQLCLDAFNDNPAQRKNMQVATCNGLARQNWILQDAGNGYFRIINQDNGLCLNDQSGSTDSDTNVQEWTCINDPKQYWMPVFVGDGYFTLANQKSGLVLDNSYGDTTPGNRVLLSTPTSGTNSQQWFMEQQ